MAGLPDDRWLVEGFLEHLEWERNLSPATLSAYRREVKRFIAFARDSLGIETPDTVKPAAVRAYLAESAERAFVNRASTALVP